LGPGRASADRFRLESFYLSPIGRDLVSAPDPLNLCRLLLSEGTLPPGLDNFNVYLLTVSPPDELAWSTSATSDHVEAIVAQCRFW